MKIPFDVMKSRFSEILIKLGFDKDKAEQCARIFAESSLDGVYTHGLNRFPSFVDMIRKGFIDSKAEAVLENSIGMMEQWNGKLAPGILNARSCMGRAIELAGEHGIGCVALRNTNHWMRGGTYGWQAADAGYIGICFTNTIANVTPWGGTDPRLGNNPLIIAVPRKEGHIVLDMAVSQYSFGKIMQYEAAGKELPFAGGYDEHGRLSTNPSVISATRRLLPIGFWKGSGLSLMLDLLASILSKGRSTADITSSGIESNLSQVFIALKMDESESSKAHVEQILEFVKSSPPEDRDKPIAYPGEHTLYTRKFNLKEGIPVNEEIWNQVLSM